MGAGADGVPMRAGVPGTVHATRERLGGREVVLVRSDPSVRKGALRHADGVTIATAAAHAVESELPLVAVIASSGADVHEGIAATAGMPSWTSAPLDAMTATS